MDNYTTPAPEHLLCQPPFYYVRVGFTTFAKAKKAVEAVCADECLDR